MITGILTVLLLIGVLYYFKKDIVEMILEKTPDYNKKIEELEEKQSSRIFELKEKLNNIEEKISWTYKYSGTADKVKKEYEQWWRQRKENFIKDEMKRLSKTKKEILNEYKDKFNEVELQFSIKNYEIANKFNQFSDNLEMQKIK